MKCSNCGAEFEGAFCPRCGKQTAPFQSTIQQPQNSGKKKTKKKKPVYKRWWFIAAIIIAAIIAISSIKTSVKQRLDWSKTELCDVLPKPDSKRGEIISDSEDELNVNVFKVSDESYKKYVSECKEKGFTVDSESSGSNFSAYNQDGYKLEIHYYDNEMKIYLNAPMSFSAISWPKSKIGKALPKPKTLKGNVISESEDTFSVYITDTSKDDYNEYIDTCADKGFNIDYGKDAVYYHAENKQGFSLEVRYEGNNLMKIYISAPDDDKDIDDDDDWDEDEENETTEKETKKSTTAPKTTSPKSSKSSTSGIRKEFKEAMDSYVEFIDEYVEFMKRFEESDGSDLKLISDYAKFTKKCSEMDEKFAEWEDDDLSTEEMAYYIDVQAKVSKKLLEIS